MSARPSPVRTVVAVLAALLGLTMLAACSTDKGASDPTGSSTGTAGAAGPEAGAYPVTVKHAFGSTTIKSEPKRIATLGWSDQDVVLSLGVVPVGAIKITWGGNAKGSTPWFDAALAKLGGTEPTRYDDTDGTPVSDVAKLSPDLILATNSGITKDDYTKLSKIAPVIAYPSKPWVTTWKQSLAMISQALGRPAAGKRLMTQTDASIAAAQQANPQLVGKSFIMGSLSTTDMSKVDYYTPEDARSVLLTELGMKVAPVIAQISPKGQFYGTISAERAATLRSDVFITYAEKAGDLATFKSNPLLGQIPALKSGHVLASTNQTEALGMSSQSPLSIPYAMKYFIPQVAKAIEG